MNLSDWMRERTSNRRMAQDLGLTLGHMSDLRNGRYFPSRRVMELIVAYTKGAVTANDFLSPKAQKIIAKAAADKAGKKSS